MSFWGVECDGKNEYKCILKKKKINAEISVLLLNFQTVYLFSVDKENFFIPYMYLPAVPFPLPPASLSGSPFTCCCVTS